MRGADEFSYENSGEALPLSVPGRPECLESKDGGGRTG